jgi:ADP-ribose pyrophosphatase YjhB (NUDIX family)
MLPKNFLPWEEYVKTLAKKACGAAAIIRNKQGDFLLEKTSYKDHWVLPGGAVDENEPPSEALRRELKEELGLNLRLKRLAAIRYQPRHDGFPDFIQFYFDGGVLSDRQIAKIKVDGEEIIGYYWVKEDHLKKYMDVSRIKNLNRVLRMIKQGEFVYLEK